MSAPRLAGRHVAVVGGGLAGIAAALDLADAGARVTLLERRRRLGGLTWSFRHDGRQIDNGQHVFLRCCTEYLRFLRRIGSDGDVVLQDRLDLTALRPGAGPQGTPRSGRLYRSGLPAPFHLGASLARYPHLTPADRARVGLAALPLRRLDLGDPALDRETFGSWLRRHGQRPAAIEALWEPITVSTINVAVDEASLAMGAKVFVTGMLCSAGGADVGWSRVPLGRLHGERAAAALDRAGVAVHLGATVTSLDATTQGWSIRIGAGGHGGVPDPGGSGADSADGYGADGYRAGGLRSDGLRADGLRADGVVVAVPHTVAGTVLPAGSVLHQDRLAELGTSAIIDVHVLYDRRVTDLAVASGLGTTAQWVFDRTETSGLGPAGAGAPQYLAASLSAADRLLGRRPDDLAREIVGELAGLFPAARDAVVLDTMVTKERHATFRAVPGAAALRPPAATAHPGLAVAGAWTDTGWPATMEGAVRSGRAAALAVGAGVLARGRTPERVA